MTTLANKIEKSKSLNVNPWLVLIVGICAATFASPFIKLAQQNGIPSPIVASGRMLLASLFISPLVWRYYRDELARLTRKDLLMAMFAGTLLQVHFQLFIIALETTSILVVTVLLNTGPLWVALIERTFLKERLNRFVWAGLFISIFGSMYIALSANNVVNSGDANPIIGATLCVLAAIAGAGQLTVGRTVRKKVTIFPYVWIVFGFGGLMGLLYAIIRGIPIIGLPAGGYFWLLMLTLIPQLIGHSSFQFALGYLTATMTSLSSQLITITAAVVAFFMFVEVPTITDIIGSSIIAFGVLIAILYRGKGKSTSEIQA